MNIHAKTTVSSFTANKPNTHVKPNTGIRIKAAFADALDVYKYNNSDMTINVTGHEKIGLMWTQNLTTFLDLKLK